LLEDFEDRPTLLDIVRLFTDEGYREYKVKKAKNPVVKNRWEKTFNAMGQREKEEIIPYFSAKFVSFNTNRIMRNIIGQTKSALNFDDVMNNGKILVINLSKGKIGELNAELLGMVLVSKIYNGAMARAKIPEKERKDFYLYVDEFQNFISGTFADILSEARKYRLSLFMAHQYIAQLE
jgi:type IV secretory pathway TraG/TraD family ATPase VirD4